MGFEPTTAWTTSRLRMTVVGDQRKDIVPLHVGIISVVARGKRRRRVGCAAAHGSREPYRRPLRENGQDDQPVWRRGAARARTRRRGGTAGRRRCGAAALGGKPS